MKKTIEWFDYLFLLRPILFYPVWTFFLAGFRGGGRMSGTSPSSGFLLLSLSAVTLLLGGVYILNQIEDRKTDRANGKLFLLANGIVPIRAALLEAVLLVAVALATGFFLSFRFGILLFLIFILTGILYNYPPFSWKDKPVFGLATNVLGGICIYSIGRLAGGGPGKFPLESIAYACAVAAAYLSTTLPDMKGDRKTGKMTFPVRYGIGKTVAWSMGFETVSVVLSLWFRNWILFIPAALALPLFIRAVRTKSIPHSVQATRFAILALAFSVCTVYPWYVIPLLWVFLLSKWYYQKRFDFNYPSINNT